MFPSDKQEPAKKRAVCCCQHLNGNKRLMIWWAVQLFCFALRIRQQLDLPLSLLLIAGQTNGRHIKIGTDALPIFKDPPTNAQ